MNLVLVGWMGLGACHAAYAGIPKYHAFVFAARLGFLEPSAESEGEREGREREGERQDQAELDVHTRCEPSESGENGVETDGERRSGLGLRVADTRVCLSVDRALSARVPHAFIPESGRHMHKSCVVRRGCAAKHYVPTSQ